MGLDRDRELRFGRSFDFIIVTWSVHTSITVQLRTNGFYIRHYNLGALFFRYRVLCRVKSSQEGRD